LERLPDWGTTVGGALFALPTPEQLTAARDGSASLATPTAWLGSCPARAIGDAARWNDPERSNELSDQMADLLPTPAAWDGNRGPDTSREQGDGTRPSGQAGTLNLAGALTLLPTPVVNDMGEGKTVEWWDEWAPRQKSSEGKKAVHGRSLSIETQRLLPTPMSRDHKDTGENTAYAEHTETQPTLPRIMMILREENEEKEEE